MANKEFFETAYKTGSDTWSRISFRGEIIQKLKEELPANAIILDLGTGRGRFALRLVESGFRVIGLDFISHIVERNNDEAKLQGYQGRARFIEGSVLDIPLTDVSVDAVMDVGTLQHLHPKDFALYAKEVRRVTKQGGLYLNISLSKDTPKFFEWYPKKDKQNDYKKYDLAYHFFETGEINTLFRDAFEIMMQEKESVENPTGQLVYLITLFQKK